MPDCRSTRRGRRVWVLSGGLWLWSVAVLADPPYPPFVINAEPAAFSLTKAASAGVTKGSVSLGGVHTTGAGSSSSVNGKLKLDYGRGCWHNLLTAAALYGAQDGHATARRYAASDLLRYALTPRRFLFSNVAGLQDRFAGYDYQISETAGYGWRVLRGKRQDLDLELGAGLAQTQEVGGRWLNDGVVRFAAHYHYRLSTHSGFTQTLEMFADPHNTHSQAVTAVDVSIYHNVGLQLSYAVTHNSRTPAGTPKTTTITSVNLLYGF